MAEITGEVKAKIPTKFPNDIDDRIYFQDIDLKQAETMQQFYSYLDSGAYSRAFELLNNSEAFFYGAWLLNMFEDRLSIIGGYISNIKSDDLTPCLLYSGTEPAGSELTDGACWVD